MAGRDSAEPAESAARGPRSVLLWVLPKLHERPRSHERGLRLFIGPLHSACMSGATLCAPVLVLAAALSASAYIW